MAIHPLGEFVSVQGTKSSVDDIRSRFDQDVERFSNLQTGQSATIDAAFAMQLIARAAAAVTPTARQILDLGSGAGNYSLKLLENVPNCDVTLVDLSEPMLARAQQRVSVATAGNVQTLQADVRDLEFAEQSFDLIIAAAVFHHLRQRSEWEKVFADCFRWLRPGGSLWIFDLVTSSIKGIADLEKDLWSEYLIEFRDQTYRNHVFEYVQEEDSPQSLSYQLNLLQQSGFAHIEVLHKRACFAAFGGIKSV